MWSLSSQSSSSSPPPPPPQPSSLPAPPLPPLHPTAHYQQPPRPSGPLCLCNSCSLATLSLRKNGFSLDRFVGLGEGTSQGPPTEEERRTFELMYTKCEFANAFNELTTVSEEDEQLEGSDSGYHEDISRTEEESDEESGDDDSVTIEVPLPVDLEIGHTPDSVQQFQLGGLAPESDDGYLGDVE